MILPQDINVLIACEESQAECAAFRQLGFNAYSCDIQPCRRSGVTEWHILGDVSPYLDGMTTFITQDGETRHVDKWHLIIAHPPCTYLCKVGSPWLFKEPVEWEYCKWISDFVWVNPIRWERLLQAREFFFKCLGARADFVAVENPIPMRLAGLPKPNAAACPSWYGVKYTKKTLYWLHNLPPLVAEIEYPKPKQYVRSSRGKYRSRTFPQMADAIARQWGRFVLDEYNEQRIR